MEDICISCLCGGRNLMSICDTNLHHIYLEILNETPTKMMESFLRVCWECGAILNRFHKFKQQSQQCYAEILLYLQQNSKHTLVKPPHLQVHNVNNISINNFVEDTHHEPTTFVDNIQLVKIHSKVKLKKVTKHRIKKKISEKQVTQANIYIKEEDLDPLCAKSEKIVASDCKNLLTAQLLDNNKGSRNSKQISKREIKKKKIKKEVIQANADISEIEHNGTFPETPPDVTVEMERLADKSNKVISNKEIKLNKIKQEIVQQNSDLSEMDVDDTFAEAPPEVTVETERLKDKPREVVKTNGVAKVRNSVPLPEKPECEECGKKFSSRKTYRYHINVLHKGQNRYPCPRCGKVYQWKSNLGRHMRSHKALDSGELYCDICDKKFASVATFKQHLRSSRRHVSETDFSFMCNECGKKFVNKTRLRDHIDWEHLNNFKFKCKVCNKPFKCHTSLYVHVQNVHRNREKKDNLCHVCGKSYQNAAKLRYHIVAMHTTETPYRCERCGAAFGWYSSLYRHVREVHHKMKVQPKKSKKTKKLLELASE